MSLGEKDYQKLLRALVTDFNHRMVNETDFLPGVPDNAHVVIQIADTPGLPSGMAGEIRGFNKWSMSLGCSQKEPEQRLCIARCRLAPLLVQARRTLTVETVATSNSTYELQPC